MGVVAEEVLKVRLQGLKARLIIGIRCRVSHHEKVRQTNIRSGDIGGADRHSVPLHEGVVDRMIDGKQWAARAESCIIKLLGNMISFCDFKRAFI